LGEGGDAVLLAEAWGWRRVAINGCQTSIGSVALTTTAITSALLAIRLMTTKRDDDDFIDWWKGGGEDDWWLLHQPAIDCSAAGNHHHRLPGWQLADQQRPQVKEDNDFDGPEGGTDKATVALQPGAKDGAKSNPRLTRQTRAQRRWWRRGGAMSFGRSMKATAINNGDGYIWQQWLSMRIIDNSYWQWLSTTGQQQQRKDSNKDDNSARMTTVLGWWCCKDGFWQWLLTMVQGQQGNSREMEHGAMKAMAQRQQSRKDGNGAGMAINNGYQWWKSMTAIDNGCWQWWSKVVQGQQGSSCLIAKTSVMT
jgi:hypothetical protein